MAKRGQIPFYCIGRAMRFRRRDVEAYLQSVKGQMAEDEG
jgi:excisionase family DNA binding protein